MPKDFKPTLKTFSQEKKHGFPFLEVPMKLINIGGEEFEVREFTNIERLAINAYESTEEFIQQRNTTNEAEKKLKNLPKHPIREKIEKQLLAKQKEFDELEQTDTIITEEQREKNELELYNIQTKLIEHADAIAREERLKEEYTTKANVAMLNWAFLNLDFLYFLRFVFDEDMAKGDLSAEDQVKNFIDTKEEDEVRLQFVEGTIKQSAAAAKEYQREQARLAEEAHAAGERYEPGESDESTPTIYSWSHDTFTVINTGKGLGSILGANRKERRAAASKKKLKSDRKALLTPQTA